MHLKIWKFLIKYSIYGIFFLFIITVVQIFLFRDHANLNKLTQNYTTRTKEQPAKKDWHDWHAMYTDSQRVGLGEQGKPATLGENIDRLLEATLYKQHGLNVLLSDAISVNRSVPDARDEGCFHKKYLSNLPTVSIVIPFHNELLSTFARTLHSLINRTPPKLLKEIILVDDFSDLQFFKELQQYVSAHFTKVRFVCLPRRMGLIRARLAGIREISSEVLVVADARIEVGYNWLPPLLEPIVLNKRTVVCPIIDWIDSEELSYDSYPPRQGAFDWTLTYEDTKISNKDLRNSTEPYNNPVMHGCFFAISRDYFWELGGYDEGLQIWGGEQFELSFKVWMCGGQMLNAPCSRVAHIFRKNLSKGLNAKKPVFLVKNKKRVAEVWLDDYKQYFYERYPNLKKMFVGNLTKQKALREKLHCKTFDWYMHEIALNALQNSQLALPTELASGCIQSAGTPNLCIDLIDGKSTPALYPCAKNLRRPYERQMFLYKLSLDLRWYDNVSCFDVPKLYENAPVFLYPCQNKGEKQFWYYDRKNKFLINRPHGSYCLEAFPRNDMNRTLLMNICDKDNLNMKWNFGSINNTAFDRFFEKFKVK